MDKQPDQTTPELTPAEIKTLQYLEQMAKKLNSINGYLAFYTFVLILAIIIQVLGFLLF